MGYGFEVGLLYLRDYRIDVRNVKYPNNYDALRGGCLRCGRKCDYRFASEDAKFLKVYVQMAPRYMPRVAIPTGVVAHNSRIPPAS